MKHRGYQPLDLYEYLGILFSHRSLGFLPLKDAEGVLFFKLFLSTPLFPYLGRTSGALCWLIVHRKSTDIELNSALMYRPAVSQPVYKELQISHLRTETVHLFYLSFIRFPHVPVTATDLCA